jgi:hypothetical protein
MSPRSEPDARHAREGQRRDGSISDPTSDLEGSGVEHRRAVVVTLPEHQQTRFDAGASPIDVVAAG